MMLYLISHALFSLNTAMSIHRTHNIYRANGSYKYMRNSYFESTVLIAMGPFVWLFYALERVLEIE